MCCRERIVGRDCMGCLLLSSSVIPPTYGGSQAVLPVAPTKYSTPGGSAKASKRTVSERTREDVPNGRRQPSHTCLILELAICEQSHLSLRERTCIGRFAAVDGRLCRGERRGVPASGCQRVANSRRWS